MSKPDLEYVRTGQWTKFVPVTDEGREVWSVMIAGDGTAAVLNQHVPSLLKRLRNMGYSVAKAKPVTETETDAILKELGI